MMNNFGAIIFAIFLSTASFTGQPAEAAAQQSRPENLREEISSLQERLANLEKEQKKLVAHYNRTYSAQQKGNYKTQIDRNDQLIQQTMGRILLLQERLAAATGSTGKARQTGETEGSTTPARPAANRSAEVKLLEEENILKTIDDLFAQKKRLEAEFNRVYTLTRKKEIEAEMKNIDSQINRYRAILLESRQQKDDQPV